MASAICCQPAETPALVCKVQRQDGWAPQKTGTDCDLCQSGHITVALVLPRLTSLIWWHWRTSPTKIKRPMGKVSSQNPRCPIWLKVMCFSCVASVHRLFWQFYSLFHPEEGAYRRFEACSPTMEQESSMAPSIFATPYRLPGEDHLRETWCLHIGRCNFKNACDALTRASSKQFLCWLCLGFFAHPILCTTIYHKMPFLDSIRLYLSTRSSYEPQSKYGMINSVGRGWKWFRSCTEHCKMRAPPKKTTFKCITLMMAQSWPVLIGEIRGPFHEA